MNFLRYNLTIFLSQISNIKICQQLYIKGECYKAIHKAIKKIKNSSSNEKTTYLKKSFLISNNLYNNKINFLKPYCKKLKSSKLLYILEKLKKIQKSFPLILSIKLKNNIINLIVTKIIKVKKKHKIKLLYAKY